MNIEDILTFVGLLVFVILFFFSLKMAYESLIKDFKNEIRTHYDKKDKNVLTIWKPLRTESKNNPFKTNCISVKPFTISPRKIYKYRLIEIGESNAATRKHWAQITIRYLMKPKIEFK